MPTPRRNPLRDSDPLAGLNYNLGAPLTPKRLRKELGSVLRLKFGGAEQALNRRKGEMPTWYQDYVKTLQGARASTAASYGAEQQAIGQRQQSSAQLDTQMANSVLGAGQADAAQRGATIDPSAGQRAVAASSHRRSLDDAFSGLLSQQAGASASRYNELGAIAAADHTRQQGRLGEAYEDLERDKGDFASAYLADTRKSERDYIMQRLAAQLAGAEFEHKVKNPDPVDPGYGDSDGDGVADKYDDAPATFGDIKPGQYSGSRKKKDGKDRFGNTRVERRRNNNDWQEALALARQSDYNDPDFALALTQGADIPSDIASAAIFWAKNGGKVNLKLAKQLRRLGIKLPKSRILGREGGASEYGGGGVEN